MTHRPLTVIGPPIPEVWLPKATAPEDAAAVVPMQGANPGSETQPPQVVNASPERSEAEARSAGAQRRIISGRGALQALSVLAVLALSPAPRASPTPRLRPREAGKQRAKDSET